MKKSKLSFCIIYVVFSVLVLIMALSLIGVDEKRELYGSTYNAAVEEPTLHTVLNGDWQTSIENWFNENFYGRTNFVITYNTIMNEIASPNNNINVGKNDYLYGTEYIQNVIGSSDYQNTEMVYDSFAINVKKLQNELEEKGKKTIYIITPSKCEIYSEYLPKDIFDHMNTYKTNHTLLVEAFEKHDVNYIDASFFAAEIKETQYESFYKQGLHWNRITAIDTINAAFNQLGSQELDYQIVDVDTPIGEDNDLYKLSNVWTKQPNESYWDVELNNTADDAYQEKICIWGTSFSQQMTDILRKDNSPYSIIKHYRYLQFGYVINKDGEYTLEIEPQAINNHFTEDIDLFDIIIFESNASLVTNMQMEIVDYLLSEFEKDNSFTSHDIVNIDCTSEEIIKNYVVSGSWGCEESGFWTTDKLELDMHLERNKNYDISLYGGTFDESYSPVLYCNGNYVGILEFKNNEATIKIPKELIEEKNRIAIYIDNVKSPIDLNSEAGDTRKLGLFLNNIQVKGEN